jgi:hypothetical protein
MENGECRMEIEWMGLIYLMQHCSSFGFKAFLFGAQSNLDFVQYLSSIYIVGGLFPNDL